MALLSPTPALFASREELIQSTRAFAHDQGYAVSIARSSAGKVWLCCDRGGHYRNTHHLDEEDRQRKTGSRLKDCPFRLYGKERVDGQWILSVQHGEHNHDATPDMSGHPLARRLDADGMERVKEMTNAGVRPRE